MFDVSDRRHLADQLSDIYNMVGLISTALGGYADWIPADVTDDFSKRHLKESLDT